MRTIGGGSASILHAGGVDGGGGVSLETLLAQKFLATAGSGTWSAPSDGVAHVFIWGASGGSGSHPPGVGGATRKRINVRKGETVSFQIGAGGPGYSNGGNSGFTPGGDGGPTSATLPDGTLLTATGGKANGPQAERNGIGSGGDENRAGGSAPSFPNGGGIGTAGGVGSVQFADAPTTGSRGGHGGYVADTPQGYYASAADESDGFGATGGNSPTPPEGTLSIKQPNGGNGAIYIDFVGVKP